MRARLALSTFACLSGPAVAWQAPTPAHSPRVLPITGPVRDAGVLHLATGTWTRKAASVSLGPDVIYNNSCSTGFYSALSGDAFTDEGRVPSPTSPNNLTSKPGLQVGYLINGFEIAYCTDQPGGPGVMTYTFYETYTSCTSPIGLTPIAAIPAPGLPGAAGPVACWIVTIDLGSPPQTANLSFSMQADGDGSYSNGTADLFGWTQESNLPDSNQLATGPIITGDPSVCAYWDGTRWDPVVNYAEPGTGMSTLDQFYVHNGPTSPGCYWFGGPPNPLASFHMRLFAPA